MLHVETIWTLWETLHDAQISFPRSHTPPKTYIEFPETALAWDESQTSQELKNMIFIKIVLAPSEIWQPWHAFFGNPEKQIIF